MIRKLTIKNFFSFKEENTISFMVHGKAPCTDAYVDVGKGERITKVLVCFGPNASGKTNLLKAIPFLHWFMKDSFNQIADAKIPVQSFRFEKANAEPTELSVDFTHEDILYRYVVHLTFNQVLYESLFIRNGRAFQYLFKRIWNPSNNKYNFMTKNFGLTRSFGEFFGEIVQMRRNASVLSIALQHNHEESKRIVEAWSRLSTNVQTPGPDGRIVPEEIAMSILDSATYFHGHPEHKKRAQELLKRFDLGLAGIDMEEHEFAVGREGKPERFILPLGVHIGHDESLYKLPLYCESKGTQNLFTVLKAIIPVLEEGGIAILDAFEVDLHPHMIRPLVDLFISRKTNPLNAQLLFSCHATDIMKHLDKYQVLLVEKDEYGYSKVIRLDEIKGVRSDDNLYAKYDSGAYGAVPNL